MPGVVHQDVDAPVLPRASAESPPRRPRRRSTFMTTVVDAPGPQPAASAAPAGATTSVGTTAAPQRASATLIARPIPRPAPVRPQSFQSSSNMAHYTTQGGRRRRGPPGPRCSQTTRPGGSSGQGRSAPSPDPLQHTCGRPRMQAAASRLPSAPATTPGAPAPRWPRRRRASARRPRWPRPGRADPTTASARSSGASRSSAGFISAQWNGALTGSGIARLAPSAFARSMARATAAFDPAMTTWPGAFMFAGLTTSPCAASSQACGHLRRVEPEDGRHRALPHRHGLLHVAAAPAHGAQRVGEAHRAGRHVRRVLAEAVPRDERRRDARSTPARGSTRRSRPGSPAACSR